jgi:hypothetical protein
LRLNIESSRKNSIKILEDQNYEQKI